MSPSGPRAVCVKVAATSTMTIEGTSIAIVLAVLLFIAPLLRGRVVASQPASANGQAIAIAMHFANKFRRVRGVLDLLAQTGDRDVHGPGRGVFRAPDVPEQLVSVDDTALVLDEIPQNVEFTSSQMDFAVRTHGAAISKINPKLTDLDGLSGRLCPSQHRTDPCDELFDLERLGDVVVSSQRKSAQLVGFLTTSREDDHAAASTLPEPAEHLEPRTVGQHDVQNHESRQELLAGDQGLVSGGNASDVEPVDRQVVEQQPSDARIIFDDQDALTHKDGLAGHPVREHERAPTYTDGSGSRLRGSAIGSVSARWRGCRLSGPRANAATTPHNAAADSQSPGIARFPVTWIIYVQIAGVNPPKMAVAVLYASEKAVARTSAGMISVRCTIIAALYPA